MKMAKKLGDEKFAVLRARDLEKERQIAENQLKVELEKKRHRLAAEQT